MRQLFITLCVIFVFTLTNSAQNTGFSQNFEKLEKGKDITKLKKGKFSAWGDAELTVSEKKGKGNNKSDKFASSVGVVNATLVRYKDLEVSATYVFSVVAVFENNDAFWGYTKFPLHDAVVTYIQSYK